jgi:hypothetical protein
LRRARIIADIHAIPVAFRRRLDDGFDAGFNDATGRRSVSMKPSIVIFGAALAVCGGALAQDSNVAAGASTQSSASFPAGRDGATVQRDADAGAAVRSQYAGASTADAIEMNATLSKPVDARRAKPGDEVVATLGQDVRTRGDIALHRGPKLVGHVTEAQPRAPRGSTSANASGSGDSRLGIVFDKAILEDGREVPIDATILAIAATETAASAEAHGFEGPPTGASTFGSGRVGSGLVGGVTGTLGGAVGGPSNLGGGISGAAPSAVATATRGASAGAVGGVNAAGWLTTGSRGVFGISGVNLETGARGASVLTSRTSTVALDRGTQLLLVGSVAGAVGAGAGGSSVTGSAR